MRHTFRTLLLAGVVVMPSAAIGQAPPDKPNLKTDAKPIIIPFELLESRHMAVQVMVNGKGPYLLIFDTGAPMNLVTNRLAKDAGVIDPNKKAGFGLFGMMGQHDVKTLKIGPATVEKIPVMVMDHPTVKALGDALDKPLDGIVGFPFFARYRMTVDYQKKELTLVPNGYVPGDYMTGLMNKLMNAQNNKDATVVGAAALWGFTADKAREDDEPGVMVKSVTPGSPATVGGLKPGDRILTLDGRWTDSIADLYNAASAVKPGREVTVVIRRDGKELKLTVKPAKGL